MWVVVRTRRDRKRDSVSSFIPRCGVGKNESAYKGLTVKHAISIAPSALYIRILSRRDGICEVRWSIGARGGWGLRSCEVLQLR